MITSKLINYSKLLILALLIASCSSNTAQSDLQLICDASKTIYNDTSLSKEQKTNAFARLVNDPNLSYKTKKFLYELIM